MQSRIITLIIFTFLMGFSAKAQTETIQLCAGESLELKSEDYYDGTYFWEFSRDQENWITISHYDSPQFNYYPEETGFYRLRIQDQACEQDYFSAIKKIEVISAEEKLVLKSDLQSEAVEEGEEIGFFLESTEGLDMMAYHLNTGQTLVTPDGKLTKKIGLEETEVYVTARSQERCFVSNKINWKVRPIAQEHNHEICGGYHISYSQWLKYHPNPESATKEQYHEYLRKKEERFEEWMEKQIAKEDAKSGEEEEVYTIPVVFHLIGFENDVDNTQSDLNYLTPEIIEDQLHQVTEDFRSVFNSSGYSQNGVDTRIEFCLALEAPQGYSLAEPGINRISADLYSWDTPPISDDYIDNNIKPNTIWDRDFYLNVWVIGGQIESFATGSTLAGYSTFPTVPINNSNNELLDGIPAFLEGTEDDDGVVVGHQFIGSIGNQNETLGFFDDGYEKTWGRVLTHEIGHFLGLRHTWGDAPDGEDGCDYDDFCDDTPNSETDNADAALNCIAQFSCGTTDMIENYMDYSSDLCMNAFTNDQKTRMRVVMENSQNRTLLKESSISCVLPTSCSNPNSIMVSSEQYPVSGLRFSWNIDQTPDSYTILINTPGPIAGYGAIINDGTIDNHFVPASEFVANLEYTLSLKASCQNGISSEAVEFAFNSGNLSSIVNCSDPYPQIQNLTAQFNTETYGADLSWTAVLGSDGVQIRMRQQGTSNWQSGQFLQPDMSEFQVPNAYLSENTTYECQVRAGCTSNGTIVGPWSEIATFETGTFGEVPCELPYPQVDGLDAQINQNEDGFLLTWNAIQGSIGCQIEYSLVNFPELVDSTVTIGSNLNAFNLDGSLLFPYQDYKARVACGCQLNPEIAGPYSEYIFFNSGDIGSLSGNEEYPLGSVHCFPGGAEVVEITNPTTGRIWMDRNLGASQVASSPTDEAAYGDLYQWGRFSDGHQCRSSEYVSSNASSHQPNNSFFYANSNGNWIDGDFVFLNWSLTNSLWDPPSLVNNPCPSGFTVPTVAEWTAEVATWSSTDVNGSYSSGSPLRLTLGGARYSSSINMAGVWGFYWSRNTTESSGGQGARNLLISNDFVQMSQSSRSTGASVRCIKEGDETGLGCIQPFPETTIQGAYAMLDNSGVRLEWNPPEFTTFCEIEYRISGTSNSTIVTVQGNEVDQYIIPADDLLQMTDYDFRVRSGCEASFLITGGWSDWDYFFTNDIGEPICQEPLPETTIQGAYAMLDGSGIRLQWYPPDNSTFCEIGYRVVGEFNIVEEIIDNGSLNQYIIPESDLMQNTDYDWRVRCGCNQQPFTVGPWSGWQAFFSGSIGQGPPPEYPQGSVHCYQDGAEVVEVTNPSTGKTWMDRNLGASQAANSYSDQSAYGDLYQWGRFSDGHQCRNSSTTTILSSNADPGHDDFILSADLPRDWLSTQNDNLWQGENGINNPCPQGFRIPTESELNNERQSWSSNNASGAFNSPLKFTGTGYRSRSSGNLFFVGSDGTYRSSTATGSNARLMYITTNNVNIVNGVRADGNSVRCIKD